MNHYCAYFDRGFLIQGVALWRSLATHDPDAVVWVLALDDFTAEALREIGGTWMRVVTLAEVEAAEPKLAAAKATRTRIEYFFTLSPCWPRWLLARHPEIKRITYVDADMFFFSNPGGIFDAMDVMRASVLVTAHRFPSWLRHYERHGRFNVGILSFRNDVIGRACLDDWYARCLAWCHDRIEDGKYADQKYLDDWPSRLGPALLVLDHAGVNLAPWNWSEPRVGWSALPPTRLDVAVGKRCGNMALHLDGQPLILFHFARFRPIWGTWWWQSGQLDYGVMPWRLRQAIYGAYWKALATAREEVIALRPGFDFPRKSPRLGREFWRSFPLRLVFGSDWLRLGGLFVAGRFGLGRWSGRALATLRRSVRGPVAGL